MPANNAAVAAAVPATSERGCGEPAQPGSLVWTCRRPGWTRRGLARRSSI